MHVSLEKDLVEINDKDNVLLVSCVFSWIKLMLVVKDSSLRIAQFYRV